MNKTLTPKDFKTILVSASKAEWSCMKIEFPKECKAYLKDKEANKLKELLEGNGWVFSFK